MKSIKNKLIVIFLFATASLLNSQTITLDGFIEQLKESHPIFEKEDLTAQINKEEKNFYLGAEDWNIFGSAAISHSEPSYAYMEPEKTNTLSFSGGVERLFWSTGGRMSLSYSSSLVDLDPNLGYPDPFCQNQIEINYSHPLLKNRNGFLDKLQFELKQYDIDLSEIKAEENLEDFIFQASDKFLDWVFLVEQEKIINERITLSEEQLDRIINKREANLVDQVDVIRAEDAVRYWQQYLVLAESQRVALQSELSVLLNNEDINSFQPSYDLYEYNSLSTFADLRSDFMNNSRIIQTIKVQLSQLQYAKKGVEELVKPNLSLVAGANLKNLDEQFGESLLMDKPSVSLGLQFSVPLGNRMVKSDIRKTDLQIAQLNKQIEEVSVALLSSLASLYSQINDLENVLKLNLELIESSRERIEEEINLYDQGRGDLTFVILSRDNEQNAKLSYAQNSLLYHKLMLQYKALTDQLFE